MLGKTRVSIGYVFFYMDVPDFVFPDGSESKAAFGDVFVLGKLNQQHISHFFMHVKTYTIYFQVYGCGMKGSL